MTSTIAAFAFWIDGNLRHSKNPDDLLEVFRTQAKKLANIREGSQPEQSDQINLFLKKDVPAKDAAIEIGMLQQNVPGNTKLVAVVYEGPTGIRILPGMTREDIEREINAITARGLPHADWVARTLRAAAAESWSAVRARPAGRPSPARPCRAA